MSYNIPYQIPVSFVLIRATPSPQQLAYGVSHGWLSREDAVRIARRNTEKSPLERKLAAVDPDDSIIIDQIVDELTVGSEPVESRAALWLFLALDWLHEHRDRYDDPFEVIATIYACFDYPPEVSHLVYWMPASGSGPPGIETLERDWLIYLEGSRRRYGADLGR